MTIPWDEIVTHKSFVRKKRYKETDSLFNLKQKIEQLPDTVGADETMMFIVKVTSQKHTLKALFATFPDTVPEGIELDVDLQIRATEP